MLKPTIKKLSPIGLILTLSTYSTMALSANLPCNVKLEFDSNSTGSVANYVLSLQLKNTSGRAVSGASVVYMDDEEQPLGNTLLHCSSNGDRLNGTVNPGSYGNCISILQKVDGAFLSAFGSQKWTQIVNTQLAALNAVTQCDVLGFAY
jgi:hypothetical protein